MASCMLCGKHTVTGCTTKKIRAGLFSHTKRKIKPNIQSATLMIDGRAQRVKACTRCLRSYNANRIRQ